MTYSAIVEMANSESLKNRIAACAANEGFSDNPESFANNMVWQIVSTNSDWEARWDDATINYNLMLNPDTGVRPDVITDALILEVVQPIVNPPEPEPEV